MRKTTLTTRVDDEFQINKNHKDEIDRHVRDRSISNLAKSVRVFANMEDPISRVLKKTQIASLAIRSGNRLLLKGGKEAKRSNAIFHKVITEAIADTVGGKVIGLVTSREEIPDLLKVNRS